MNNCSFQECDREEYCKSLCKSHYYMLKKKGILTSIKQRNTNYNYIKCNTNGCNNKHKAKGFCKLQKNNLGYMYFESKEKNNLIIDEIEFLNEEFKKETNKYSE